MSKLFGAFLLCVWIGCAAASTTNYWVINPSGGITWQIDGKLPHEDHIAISGHQVSAVLRYGVDGSYPATGN